MDEIILYLRDFNFASVAARLVLAMMFGGMLGMNRAKKRRAAGFRTYMLVCLGATLAMLLGQYETELLMLHWGNVVDPAGNRVDVVRFGAQVINGIGFLGAGTILIRNQAIITGLTTAAGVWCTATIGIALGYGFYWAAIIATAITIVTATLLTRLEGGKKKQMRVYMELKDADKLTPTLKAIHLTYSSMKHPDISMPKSGLNNAVGLSFEVSLEQPKQQNFLEDLSNMDNVLFAIEE